MEIKSTTFNEIGLFKYKILFAYFYNYLRRYCFFKYIKSSIPYLTFLVNNELCARSLFFRVILI